MRNINLEKILTEKELNDYIESCKTIEWHENCQFCYEPFQTKNNITVQIEIECKCAAIICSICYSTNITKNTNAARKGIITRNLYDYKLPTLSYAEIDFPKQLEDALIEGNETKGYKVRKWTSNTIELLVLITPLETRHTPAFATYKARKASLLHALKDTATCLYIGFENIILQCLILYPGSILLEGIFLGLTLIKVPVTLLLFLLDRDAFDLNAAACTMDIAKYSIFIFGILTKDANFVLFSYTMSLGLSALGIAFAMLLGIIALYTIFPMLFQHTEQKIRQKNLSNTTLPDKTNIDNYTEADLKTKVSTALQVYESRFTKKYDCLLQIISLGIFSGSQSPKSKELVESLKKSIQENNTITLKNLVIQGIYSKPYWGSQLHSDLCANMTRV